MRDRIQTRWRRLIEGRHEAQPLDNLPHSAPVVQFCHPAWRGVRTSSYAFGPPVVESADLSLHADSIASRLAATGTERIVVQGWPPGAAVLARAARAKGLAVAAVSHASLAQHGPDAGEAERVAEVLALATEGVVDRVGFVKRGLAAAFAAMGHPASELLNRKPVMPDVEAADLGPGDHVGVFLFPYWRKNVTTQLAAAALLGATAHVMHDPAIPYLPEGLVVSHGELTRERFLPLLAGVALNLHVTLSECHPMMPMESYLLGVPSLISPTSTLFEDDRDLLDLTTVVEADNPERIAAAARNLLDHADVAVDRARASLDRMDVEAAARWDAFVT